MTIQDEPREYGDPYIGLYFTANQVLQYVDRAVSVPLAAAYPPTATLGSPSVFDDIASFFRDILYWVNPLHYLPWLWSVTVSPAISWLKAHLFENVQSYIGDRINWVRDKIDDVKKRLADIYLWCSEVFGAGIARIREYIEDTYKWLRDTLGGAIDAVRSAISNVAVDIYGQFVVWFNWGKGEIERLARWSREVALPAIAAVGHFIQGIPQAIYDWAVGWYVWGKAQIEAARSWWNETGWPAIAEFFAMIVQGSVDTTSAIDASVAQAKESVAIIVPEKAAEAIDALEGRVLGWFEDFKDLPQQYLAYVTERAGTDLALEPERAFSTIGDLYAMSIGAGSAAHVVATALNAIPTLNWVGASQLSAFIAEVAGFTPITNASYGVLLNECLAIPLRYYWNRQLRPRIPTEGAIYAMGRKRGLTYEEFSDAMAMQGLPQSWIDKEYDFFWTDPSPYWLLRMSETANPKIDPSDRFKPWLDSWLPEWRADPWAWYKMKLMLAGFEDTDIPAFIEGFQRRMVSPAITRVKTAVRHMAREAYWDHAEIKAALEPLGVREAEVTYLIQAEELEAQNAYLDDQVRYYNESFRKGQLSAQDLSLVLSTIIVKPEIVAQIVGREQVRALPKPKSIVSPKEDPRVKSLVTQAVNSWTKGYRAWEVEEEELEIGLTIVLQDPALAKQMVVVERTRYRPPPPPPPPIEVHPLVVSALRAAVASWIARYRAWEIDADVLYNTLVSILEDEPLAREIVDTERARYREPLPPVPPIEVHPLVASALRAAVASWIARYRAWEIDARELEVALVRVLEDEPLAREIVATEQARYRPPPLPPPVVVEDPLVRKARTAAIATWVAQFREGVITAAVMELGLANLIVDPDIVVLIRQIEELRAVPAPDILPPWEEDPAMAAVREEIVRGHIEMFRKGIIDIDELYTYLLADGLVQPLARATALTQALKRIKTPPLDSPYFQKDRVRTVIDEAIDSYTRMLELGQITMEEFEAYLAGAGVDPALITYLGDTQQVRRFIQAAT